MKSVLISTLVVLVCAAAGGVFAEEEPVIVVSELTDNLYMLSTDQGSYTTNTLVFLGEDGLLLVDTQAAENAPDLKRVVDGFGLGAPKIIINTHRHVEHVGGNAIFGDEPIVIAHELVSSKLRSGSYLFNEFPEATFPDISFSDEMTLFYNGETIRLIAMPGSHDDNEIIVHFTESKVVHLSSLVNGFNFPSVDGDGSALMFAELVAKAIEILPEDVVIVSGHNRTGTWRELHAYHDMLVGSTEVVRKGLAAGKDGDALKEEKALEQWKAYAGSYVSVDRWTEYLVAALEGGERKKTVFEPLYYSLRDDGADAAVALYRDLKSNHADEYDFGDADLLVIADKLLEKDKVEQAIALLHLNLEVFPEGKYTYYVNYELALAHQKLGDGKLALAHCETALELNPESEMIKDLLEELRQGPTDTKAE